MDAVISSTDSGLSAVVADVRHHDGDWIPFRHLMRPAVDSSNTIVRGVSFDLSELEVGELVLTVSGSIGVALTLGPVEDPNSLHLCADNAMYMAKRAGRPYVICGPGPTPAPPQKASPTSVA